MSTKIYKRGIKRNENNADLEWREKAGLRRGGEKKA